MSLFFPSLAPSVLSSWHFISLLILSSWPLRAFWSSLTWTAHKKKMLTESFVPSKSPTQTARYLFCCYPPPPLFCLPVHVLFGFFPLCNALEHLLSFSNLSSLSLTYKQSSPSRGNVHPKSKSADRLGSWGTELVPTFVRCRIRMVETYCRCVYAQHIRFGQTAHTVEPRLFLNQQLLYFIVRIW